LCRQRLLVSGLVMMTGNLENQLVSLVHVVEPVALVATL
jgi:hypothetical protein